MLPQLPDIPNPTPPPAPAVQADDKPSAVNALFKSKRFITTLVGMVVMIVSTLVPQLADQLDILAPTIVILVGVAVGGYSVQDAAREIASRREPTDNPPAGA